jgi:hypothetical protein
LAGGIGIAVVLGNLQRMARSALVRRDDKIWDWVQVIRSEYLEMPGLSLTKPQAQRLWGLDARTCDVLIDQMVSGKFLRRTPGACYVRNDIGY